MTAGSMVTRLESAHTVTNAGRHRLSPRLGVAAATAGGFHAAGHPCRPVPGRDGIVQPPSTADGPDSVDDPGITEELLVEEVSIDGMCGVY